MSLKNYLRFYVDSFKYFCRLFELINSNFIPLISYQNAGAAIYIVYHKFPDY